MIHKRAPIALHDITQAALDAVSGCKPIPLSSEPGDAPMRAVPVIVTLRDNGRTHVIRDVSMTLAPHVKANHDPDARTARMGEAGGEPVSVGVEQAAQLVFHVRIPDGYRMIREVDYIAWKQSQEPTPEPPAIVQAEQSGPSSEQIAIAATRKAHGLEPQSPQAVFAVDTEAAMRCMREQHRKPAIGQSEGYG